MSSLSSTLRHVWDRLAPILPIAKPTPDLSGAFERVSFETLELSQSDLFRLENRSFGFQAVALQKKDITYNILLNAAAQRRITADPEPPNLSDEQRAHYLLSHGGLLVDGYDGDQTVPAFVAQRNDGARVEIRSKDGRTGVQTLFDQTGQPHGRARIIPL